MTKKIIKFDDNETEEFYQYKTPISINDIDINKIVIPNKFPFGKKDFNISLVTKTLKKLDLYAYSIHKLLYIKENY